MFNISAQQNREFLQLLNSKNHPGLKTAKSSTDSFLAMVSNALMLNNNFGSVPKPQLKESIINPNKQNPLGTKEAKAEPENKLSLRELLNVKNLSTEKNLMYNSHISEELKSADFEITAINALTDKKNLQINKSKENLIAAKDLKIQLKNTVISEDNSSIKGTLKLLKLIKTNPEKDLLKNSPSIRLDNTKDNSQTTPASLEQEFSAFLNVLTKSAQGNSAENMVHKKIVKLSPEQKVQVFQILKTIESQTGNGLPESNLVLINSKNEPAKIQIKNNNATIEITAPLSVKKDLVKVMPFVKHLVRNGLEKSTENVALNSSEKFTKVKLKKDQESGSKISSAHALVKNQPNKNNVGVKNESLETVKSQVNPKFKESLNPISNLSSQDQVPVMSSKKKAGESASPKVTKSAVDETIVFNKTETPVSQFKIDRKISVKLLFVDKISINENKAKASVIAKTDVVLKNKINSEMNTTDKTELQGDNNTSASKTIKNRKIDFSNSGNSTISDTAKHAGLSTVEKVNMSTIKDNPGIQTKQNQESSQPIDVAGNHREKPPAIDRNQSGNQHTGDSGNKNDKPVTEIKLNALPENNKNADKAELFSHTLESVKTSFQAVPKTAPLVKEIPAIIQRYYDNQNQTFTQNKVVVDAGEMGKLDIRFNESTSARSLLILVENESAKNEMQRLAPVITENLANRGVHVSSLNIDIGHSGTKNEKRNSSKNNSQGTMHAGNTEGDHEKNSTLNKKRYYGYNSMDIVA